MSIEQQLHLHPSREGAHRGAPCGGVVGVAVGTLLHRGPGPRCQTSSPAREGASERGYRAIEASSAKVEAPCWARARTKDLPSIANDFGGQGRLGLLFGEVPTS